MQVRKYAGFQPFSLFTFVIQLFVAVSMCTAKYTLIPRFPPMDSCVPVTQSLNVV